MKRRAFLRSVFIAGLGAHEVGIAFSRSVATAPGRIDPGLTKEWLERWEKGILESERSRYCEHEMAEELGWLMSPFLNGFYYGYLATRDVRWIERLTDWTGAWVRRGVTEPDGYMGWPKGGTGGQQENDFYTDSLLGEAMAFRPVVLMAAEVKKDETLQKRFGKTFAGYVQLAEKTFYKWKTRGCWREVKNGGLWVVPAFGIDQKTGRWSDGYVRREKEGFSNPANKQNHIARWLLAMSGATGKPVYREHARQWFQVMQSRMRTREDGKYFVWNYWDPAGPWDLKADGTPRHWVGVHPNGGYYAIDVEGIVTAFEERLVFTQQELKKLIATNRDFMWNQQVDHAKFQRIDGGESDPRWKDSPGLLWTALVPHDPTLREIFLKNHDPASWSGLSVTPWFLSRERSA